MLPRCAWISLILLSFLAGCVERAGLDEALTGRQRDPAPAATEVDRGVVDAAVDAALVCEGETPCGPPAVGVCRPGVRACIEGVPGPCTGAREPGQEICDTLDNDCDGQTDEVECPGCMPGTLQPCFSGPENTLNVGPCRAGVQRCGPEGRFGVCQDEVVPLGEACDGRDDDCDGRADEDFAEQVGRPCQAGTGACRIDGVFLCNSEGLRCSAREGVPSEETCNALDDDCDGPVDEGFGVGEPCTAGAGACQRQDVLVCGDDGAVCPGASGAPIGETCNDQDDDCDGRADEGLIPCYGGPEGTAGIGQCRRGRSLCGQISCAEQVLPVMEGCNGLDDDCDGTADEGLDGCRCDEGTRVACYEGEGQPGFGICTEGQRRCGPDGTFGPCEGAVGPRPEECNGLDDDCDGNPDEGLLRTCGQAGGRCREGQQRCVEGGWAACEGAVGPRAESCNAVDDDCDGPVDEDIARACGEDRGECRGGEQRCIGGAFGPCEGAVEPAPEACNGQDDDCDGTADEGVQNPCGGCGASPVEQCNGRDDDCDGRTDEQVEGPVPAEQCNGRDEDCDGRIDEDLGECRPCDAAGDCDDDNPCTAESCEDGRCVVQAVDIECDDGDFCNGPDQCRDGRCDQHPAPVACARFCSEDQNRCVDCTEDAHCPAPMGGDWSECIDFQGECGQEGRQVRLVFWPACQQGDCVGVPMEEVRPCQRPTDGWLCAGGEGLCVGGACRPLRTITAESTGRNIAARARVTCPATGQSCVSSGTFNPCSVTCPEGARVQMCCSNGSACGGAPIAPRFDRILTLVEPYGLLDFVCTPFGPGDLIGECEGTVEAQNGGIVCFYEDEGFPR